MMDELNLSNNSLVFPTHGLRPVYGTIYGWDMDADLLLVQIGDGSIVPIADASFTLEDTYLFGQNPIEGTKAIKVLPAVICPSTAAMLVEIDVEGFRLLKFIEMNGYGPFIGVIVKIESDGFIVALPEGVWGKLSAYGEHFNESECVGYEVEVSVCDIDVMANMLRLELAEEECDCTLLVEAN
ncbi:MAG: hypothetical protein ACKER6_01125 [Candidatus Hodgkinia cicadicola]